MPARLHRDVRTSRRRRQRGRSRRRRRTDRSSCHPSTSSALPCGTLSTSARSRATRHLQRRTSRAGSGRIRCARCTLVRTWGKSELCASGGESVRVRRRRRRVFRRSPRCCGRATSMRRAMHACMACRTTTCTSPSCAATARRPIERGTTSPGMPGRMPSSTQSPPPRRVARTTCSPTSVVAAQEARLSSMTCPRRLSRPAASSWTTRTIWGRSHVPSSACPRCPPSRDARLTPPSSTLMSMRSASGVTTTAACQRTSRLTAPTSVGRLRTPSSWRSTRRVAWLRSKSTCSSPRRSPDHLHFVALWALCNARGRRHRPGPWV
mmetsp:Transcript_6130/g.15694  ORF Transcript_6130/g.15694 Transcript_6130/m.15694 type:complete len:322 (+) Transcript_6130:215-1180(+)